MSNLEKKFYLESDENEVYRYYLVNSPSFFLIFFIIVAFFFPSVPTDKHLINAAFMIIVFVFLVIDIFRKLQKKELVLKDLVIPFYKISFNSNGIFSSRGSIYIPWEIVVDIYDFSNKDSEKNTNRLWLYYLNTTKDSVDIFEIAGWSWKFSQIRNFLIDMKEKHSPKNLKCTLCHIDFDVDAQDSSIVYSCKNCNKTYTYELKE